MLLPKGSFVPSMESTHISKINCIASCKTDRACNALIVGPKLCRRGTVNLNYAGAHLEPMESVYVEEGKVKSRVTV